MGIHFFCSVKKSGHHKVILASGGHLTEATFLRTFSRVVSLKCIILFLFIEELNGLESWKAGTGSICLEAKTKEKVYVKDTSEFGTLKYHTLIINK